MINTNGKRIARDDEFLEQLKETKPSLHFQFDGFDSETYRIIRGEPDILKEKLLALDRLASIGLNVKESSSRGYTRASRSGRGHIQLNMYHQLARGRLAVRHNDSQLPKLLSSFLIGARLTVIYKERGHTRAFRTVIIHTCC